MPRGFGRGFWGYGGFWPGWGWRGNPFPFCRWFPWLPRWWWATPYAFQFASTIPYFGGYGFPYWGGYPLYTGGSSSYTGTGYPGVK